MIARIQGDENEITIEFQGVTYKGDLHELSEDEGGPEIWEIEGERIETDSILCRLDLEDLAREFLRRRGLEATAFEVESDSFDE